MTSFPTTSRASATSRRATQRPDAAPRSPGLLIVNADDWGIDRPTTDAIAACVDARRVSSVSAMVWMDDEERAARLARERGVPAGLHLNLVEPYSGDSVPGPARLRQSLVTAWFERSRHRRWLPAPGLRREIARCVHDQLERFRELYGTEPTHIDGHRHFHTSPTVLAALPRGMAVRASFTYLPGERSRVNRLARAATNRAIARRFPATKWFFSIREIDARKLALARDETVEVMCHPGWDDESALLMSDDWLDAVDGLPLGSFADLRP